MCHQISRYSLPVPDDTPNTGRQLKLSIAHTSEFHVFWDLFMKTVETDSGWQLLDSPCLVQPLN